MGDLIAGILAITLIWVIVQAIWPVLAVMAAAALLALLVYGIAGFVGHHAHITVARRRAISSRADRQHQLIMSGDTIGGTYGEYLPPAGLR